MVEAAVVGARLLQFASTMILFGSSLFYLYGLKDGANQGRWPKRLLAGAAYIALLSIVAGIALQAALLGGDVRAAIDMPLMQSMLMETGFGRILVLRLITGIAAFMVAVWLRNAVLPVFARVLAILGAVLLASFTGTGHGALNEGSAGIIHATGDMAHNFAAAIWIGALVPIAILIGRSSVSPAGRDVDERVATARHGLARFSAIGIGVIALLVASGLVNSWFLVGPQHVGNLMATPYGVMLVVKLALFGAMLALAAVNRFWLTPWLGESVNQGTDVAGPVAILKFSIFSETGLALLVLLAVSLLGTWEPPVSFD